MDPRRIEAAQRGDVLYEGKPCRSCGDAVRYVNSGACVACKRAFAREHYQAWRDFIRSCRDKDSGHR